MLRQCARSAESAGKCPGCSPDSNTSAAGGGVISAGRPLRGTRSHVGELGHIVAARWAVLLLRVARLLVGEAALCRALGLPEDTPRGVVVAELRSLETAPQPGPLDEFAEWLATGLVTVVNMMAPELVVLGDLFTALPAGVVDHVRGLVHERSLVSRAVGGTRIETSPLGRDATLVGAAELASNRCSARSSVLSNRPAGAHDPRLRGRQDRPSTVRT